MSQQTQEPVELDRKDLKIKALLEKINEYEERNADLRVELTLYSSALEETSKRNEELTAEVTRLTSESEGTEDVQASAPDSSN